MTMPAQEPVERVSFAEYLRREEKALNRHEFHEGEILAMSGGTHRHARIASQTLVALAQRLAGGPCYPVGADSRLRQKQDQRYVYPDLSVICGEAELDPSDPKQTTITNARLVVEVLSDSTEAYDRGEKFYYYRLVESLREYVLVSQMKPLIEVFLRKDDGSWTFDSFSGLDTVARLRSLEIDLPLAEVYAGLSFENRDTAQRGQASV